MTNVLVALKNLLDLQINDLINFYSGKIHNRANNMGDALEYYVKDLFCGTMDIQDFDDKDKAYSTYLSYGGNSNNPPDFIIRKGPAVEVKKIENLNFGRIALNSSYPKDVLHSDSSLLKKEAVHCEDSLGSWIIKDMIYAIGNIDKGNKLRMLWLLYGDCYAATNDTYERIKHIIKEGVEDIQGIEFTNTKELGKVLKIDPLGITDLRVRGMWNIEHPQNVFTYLTNDYSKDTDLQVYTLILKDKYDKLPKKDKDNLKKYLNNKTLIMHEVDVKNPNNTANYLKAIFFKASLNFTKEE